MNKDLPREIAYNGVEREGEMKKNAGKKESKNNLAVGLFWNKVQWIDKTEKNAK